MATNAPPLRSEQEIINYSHARSLSAHKVALVSTDGTQMVTVPVDNPDASLMRVSTFSDDAGLMRVSTVGSISTTESTPDTIYSNQNTVSAANSANPLSGATQSIREVLIRADDGNSGEIYVGTSAVSGTNGYVLSPGDSISMAVDELSAVWYSLETADDGLSYIALN